MTRAEILTLARSYAIFQRCSLSTVGMLTLENNMIFRKLADGGDALASNIERAAEWFSDNWPEGLSWPEGIQRPKNGRRSTGKRR